MYDGDLEDEMSSIVSEEWTSDFRKNQERVRLIDRVKDLCGPDDGRKRPLHVVIIGTAGVGKSSFINTLAAALDGGRWREVSTAGSYGPKGGQMTVFTKTFKKCGKGEKYKDVLLPTVIDIAGFRDQAGEEFTELLRIVFYGRLQENESLAEAAECYKSKGLDGLRAKYKKSDEKLKVDRIIFVSSASEIVPENLIECVISAAKPSGTKENPWKRTIPLFGAMVKFDKVVTREELKRMEANGEVHPADDFVLKEDYEKRELQFINALGLKGSTNRFLRCSNYCDDVDKEQKRIDTVFPDLDIPVLRFFTQVADNVYEVQSADETLLPHVSSSNEPDTDSETRCDPQQNPSQGPNNDVLSILLISVEAILVAFILNVLLTPAVDMATLKGVCSFGQAHGDRALPAEMRTLCQGLDSSSFSQQIKFFICFLLLIAIRIGCTFGTLHIFKQK